MDNNTVDPHSFPSAEELQRMANAYFAEPSASGIGVSPQQFEDTTGIQNQVLDLSHGTDINPNMPGASAISEPYQEQVKSYPALDFGYLPKSVAGSGASPSVSEHGKVFNIEDPQTSLRDPHFENGKIP